MRKDKVVNKAVRAYAKVFIGKKLWDEIEAKLSTTPP